MFVYISLCNLMKKVHKFLLGHFVAYLSIIQSNVKLLKQANATCCRCLRIVVRHFPARFGGHSFKAVVLPFCYFINQATYKRSFLRGSNTQYQCKSIRTQFHNSLNICSLQQTPYFFHGIFPNFIEQKTKKMRFWSKIKI